MTHRVLACLDKHAGPFNPKGVCKPCQASSVRAYKARHPARVAKTKAKLKGYHQAYSADWYRRNQTLVNERNKAWRELNSDRNKETNATWKRTHSDKVADSRARRRAAELQAIPAWADFDRIAKIYELAKQLRELGCEVHVDHIVPLQSPLVCGLHVHDNLRVILATDNASKANRHWPDMP